MTFVVRMFELLTGSFGHLTRKSPEKDSSRCEPGSKLLVLGMVIPPLMTGILIMGPYKPLRNSVGFSHPLLCGNIGS